MGAMGPLCVPTLLGLPGKITFPEIVVFCSSIVCPSYMQIVRAHPPWIRQGHHRSCFESIFSDNGHLEELAKDDL